MSVSQKTSFESIRCFLYSYLEECPWNNSVDYKPAAVATAAPSPNCSLPRWLFFPPAIVDTVNGWLSQIITSDFHAGVQPDLYGSAPHVLLRVPHRLDCSCARLSCSAAGGSERGIITPCPGAASVFGPARITWSSLCNSPSSGEIFRGRINNSRLPLHRHVSTNESSHQKSKVGQLSSSFSTSHLFAAQQRINSLLTAAQLGRL